MENKEIGYRIHEVSKKFHRRVKDIASQNGISSTYFQILGFLRHNDNNVTQKDICEFVKMKAPTISIALQSMEVEGYITRVKSTTDSRFTYVVLTDKGFQTTEMVKTYFDDTERLLMESVSQDELEIFLRCLEKMKMVLEKR